MTGFGKALCETESAKVSVEIKSVNGNQLDLKVRMPSAYNEKELTLRSLIAQILERGTIDLNINIDSASSSSNYTFNKNLALKYFDELSEIAKETKSDKNTDFIGIITKLPDVLKSEKPIVNDSEWELISKTINKAIEDLDISRKNEGVKLEKDFKIK